MDSKSESSSRLDAATKAVSFNVLLQVLLRVASFVLNGVTLRFVHAELLGVVNLRLTLLYDTILFLSREALRKAAMSRSGGKRQWAQIINLLWISLPVGVVLSLLLSAAWLSPLIPQPPVSWDQLGVVIYALSALTELLMEPLWVMAQDCGHVSIKVVAEGIAQGVRCTIVLVGVVTMPQYALVVFAVAQLACSMTHTLLYYAYFTVLLTSGRNQGLPISAITDLVPHRGPHQQLVTPLHFTLAWSFFKQSFLKQLLTKGEHFVMTVFGILSFAEQGVYDVINNLGSLVARFIFLPIEESFYVFFAATLMRGVPADKQTKGSVLQAGIVLSHLLKLVILIALTIISFGYAYSYLALDLYGGSILSSGSGPALLRWYCLYVLFLAVNGVTECFMFAAMSQRQVDRYNGSMLVFSALFLGAATFLTTHLGSVGFILANCINMATRIVHSCHFIHSFFKSTTISPLTSAVPSLTLWVAFPLAWAATTLSEGMLCCSRGPLYRLLHVLVGCVCLVMVALTVLLSEHQLCVFLIDRLPAGVARRVRRLLRLIPGTSPLHQHHKQE